jgi:hypothetical protein
VGYVVAGYADYEGLDTGVVGGKNDVCDFLVIEPVIDEPGDFFFELVCLAHFGRASFY